MLSPEGRERAERQFMRGLISERDLESKITGKGLEHHVTTQTSIQELEAAGWAGEEWEEFKALFQEGDEIWNYSDLAFTCGSFGVVMLRNGEAIGYILIGKA